MTPTRFTITVDRHVKATACEAIAARTGLPKARIKQAMVKGAVWLVAGQRKMRRLRRATTLLSPGERIAFYYDPEILALQPPTARCMEDFGRYSIWFKPAGLMTQGTRFGDHCSLVRQVEKHFQSKHKIHLVHRLDRETAGLVIIAHDSKAAALFSKMFQEHRIEKWYMAWLLGDLRQDSSMGTIVFDLGGRQATTDFAPVRYVSDKDQTLVKIRIHTGRFHQIRRHFEFIGHPVMGDPRYGRNNKNRQGLQLVAYALRFKCPLGRGQIDIRIDPEALGLL